MEDTQRDQPIEKEAQNKSRADFILPILSIIVGFAVLVWWLGSWFMVGSMSWGMFLAIMLPGLGGVLLVLYGVVALIKRTVREGPEKK